MAMEGALAAEARTVVEEAGQEEGAMAEGTATAAAELVVSEVVAKAAGRVAGEEAEQGKVSMGGVLAAAAVVTEAPAPALLVAAGRHS